MNLYDKEAIHIGIVTGSVSQSEDDRRGAEAFQAAHPELEVKLAIYPDNFTEELETTIQTIVNMSDDPDMKAACEEFGMSFVLETAPDPTTDVGVAGAQAYILEKVPEWVDKYGEKAAYFCTNDAHTEPLLKQLLEYGGYFIEADLPSPPMGYPGALGVDLTTEAGDYAKILAKVEAAVVEKGGEGRFGTWAYSYGYTVSAGLAEHALNVIKGESELCDIDDIAKAYEVYSPGAAWNGSNYTNAQTGVKADNTFLVYQDTYGMGNPGKYMGAASVEIPEQYFTIS